MGEGSLFAKSGHSNFKSGHSSSKNGYSNFMNKINVYKNACISIYICCIIKEERSGIYGTD